VLDVNNSLGGVWADATFLSAKNAAMLEVGCLVSCIQRKKP
jgi:hypothetical protein